MRCERLMREYEKLSKEIIEEMNKGKFSKRKWKRYNEVFNRLLRCLKRKKSKNRLPGLDKSDFLCIFSIEEKRRRNDNNRG